MIYSPSINFFVVLFCLIIVIASCGQFQSEKSTQLVEVKKNVQFDTSKNAIIPFDIKNNYPFGSSNKLTTLAQNDIRTIDSLLIACVIDYNNSLAKDREEWSIDLKKYSYKRQLVLVENINGEKEVWINCFCETFQSDKWKTEIMLFQDGGNCCFNFKINLTTRKFYNMVVNGVA